jgi:predicted dienelactone hydrolase
MTSARSGPVRTWRRWLVLTWFSAPSLLFAQAVTGVGFHAITIHDPVNGGSMPGYVFYPSAQAKGVTTVGPYDVDATRDAAPIPGAKPLVVVSHGNGGSDLGHSALATYLASHGFIVATLEHSKDNFHDTSGVGHSPVLVGRPIQVKATISALLDDPQWKNLIDANRIGVTGFSAGGYTSLLVVGAIPHFARFIDYCHRYPDDAATCHDANKIKAEAASRGMTLDQWVASIQGDLTRWGNTADPRVKAAFVMAPLSLIFDQDGIEKIDRPVYLYYGAADHVLRPSENAARIRPWMKTLVGFTVIPKADHWVFIDPCTAELSKDNPVICSDPPGVDRLKMHAQLDADALAFFRKTLHVAPTH